MTNMRVIPAEIPDEDPDRSVLVAFASVADALGFGHEGPDSRDLAFGVMAYGDNREVGLGTPWELNRETGEAKWHVALLTYDDGEMATLDFPADETVAAFQCAVNGLLHGVLNP